MLRRSSLAATAFAAGLLVVVCAIDASAARQVVRQTLQATGVDADARGTALVVVRSTRAGRSARLDVRGARLERNRAGSPQATGELLDGTGATVASATVACELD